MSKFRKIVVYPVVLFFSIFIQQSQAQVVGGALDFQSVYSATAYQRLISIGADNLLCLSGVNGVPADACSRFHDGNDDFRNNSIVAGNHDIDDGLGIPGSASTFNSSQVAMTFPNTPLVYALLSWQTVYNQVNLPSATDRQSVKLSLDGGTYADITATRGGEQFLSSSPDLRTHAGYSADVTSLISQLSTGANHQIVVADIDATLGTPSGGAVGGWSLTMVFAECVPQNEQLRHVSIIDGFRVSPGQIDIPLSGFNTGTTTPVSGTSLSVFGADGDLPLFDSISFGPDTSSLIALSDGLHPADLFLNSRQTINGTYISTLPAPYIGRTPNEQIGFQDIVQLTPNTAFDLPINTTSAVLRVTRDTTPGQSEAVQLKTLALSFESAQVGPTCADYGDAPTGYQDAFHDLTATSSNLYLGSVMGDQDLPGSQNIAPFQSNALGDDSTTGDDEDGVTFPPYSAGSVSYTVPVNLTNTTSDSAIVCGWIDLDLNGAFDNNSVEESCMPIAASVGSTTLDLVFNVSGITLDSSADYYARFRICTLAADCDAPTGQAPVGEVEDYLLAVVTLSEIVVTKTVAGVDTGMMWSFDFSLIPVGMPVVTPVLSSADATASGIGSVTSMDTVTWSHLVPGEQYVIGETPVADYTAGAMICTDATGTALADADRINETVTFTAPMSVDNVTFEVRCAIINTALPSDLAVTKTVISNATTDWSFDFTLTPSATVVTASPAIGNGNGNAVVSWTYLIPGTTYTVAEDTAALAGYTAGALSCTGVDDTDGDASNASVTFIAPFGDGLGTSIEIICAITNQQWPDLAVVKTVDPGAVLSGETLVFTISVTNDGILPATSVELTDVLPAGLTYVSAVPSTGSYDNTSGVWTIGTIISGANEALTLTTLLDPAAAQCVIAYRNAVTVSSQGEIDFDTTNNTDDASASLISIALVKQLNGNAAVDNGNGTYTVTYEFLVVNNGGEDLFGVQIEEDLLVMLNSPQANNATFIVNAVVSPDTTLTPNPGFDGLTGSDINLLSGNDGLVSGAQGRVDVTFTLTPDVYFGPFDNLSLVNAVTGDGVAVDDFSEDGALTPSTPGLSTPFVVVSGHIQNNKVSPDDACVVDGPTPFQLSVSSTPITLGSFNSTAQGSGQVLFEWATESEIANAGYILWAQAKEQSIRWFRLSTELIESQGESLRIQRYQYNVSGVDSTVFRLTDVSVMGKQVHHGPFTLGEHYGDIDTRKATDWESILYYSDQKQLQRDAQRRQELEQRLQQSVPNAAPDSHKQVPQTQTVPPVDNHKGLNRVLGALLNMLIAPAHATELMNMTVNEDGIYRVTDAELKAAGLNLTGIRLDRLGLKSNNHLAPVLIKGANKTNFGVGGYIEFPAQALWSTYANANQYTLVIDEGQSLIFADARPIPSDTELPAAYSYLATKHYAPENHYSRLSPDRGGDSWYADKLKAIQGAAQKRITLHLDDHAPAYNVPFGTTGPIAAQIADVKPTLDVELWGASSLPGNGQTNPDHRVIIDLNGKRIADERFDGLSVRHVNKPLNGLISGNNQINITVPKPTSRVFDLVNLDAVSISYPRRFIAQNNGGSLVFPSNWTKFRVRGLNANGITVYRLHQATANRLVGVQMTEIEMNYIAGYGHIASFAGIQGEGMYYVATTAGIKHPELSIAPSSDGLFEGSAAALVIAHGDFIGTQGYSLERYAAELGGIYGSAKIVNVDSIYARYSGHVVDAKAIHVYIKQAYALRGTRHVYLIGGDMYDYHNNLGLNAKSFVPSLYVRVGLNLNAIPSDSKYGDIDNDNVPDIDVSRLPVRTESELRVLLSKRKAYMNRDYVGKAVFSADKIDGAGYQFKSDSEEIIASQFTGWKIDRVYLDTMTANTAASALKSSINAGVSLTSYFGHSSTNTWSLTGFFSGDDAARLTNTGKPTVVTQWGCWNTFHVSPDEESMAHRLLMEGDRGAVVVMGASSLTQASAEKLMATLLFERLNQGMRIGNAVLSAKRALAKTHPHQLDVLLGWSILGPSDLIVAH